MDVREFFELSVGKWFSQKTSHHLTLKQSEQGKSDLFVEILPVDNSQVVTLCQQAGVDPSSIWGGVKYSWKGTISWDPHPLSPPTQQGESILIASADLPPAKTGKIFQSIEGSESPRVIRYAMGDDDALTLITELEKISCEERVWFESDNVRLRTTIVTQDRSDALASFYSEIRMRA